MQPGLDGAPAVDDNAREVWRLATLATWGERLVGTRQRTWTRGGQPRPSVLRATATRETGAAGHRSRRRRRTRVLPGWLPAGADSRAAPQELPPTRAAVRLSCGNGSR